MNTSHWQLSTLLKHYQEVQEKITSATESLEIVRDRLGGQINVEDLLEVLQSCQEVIISSKQLMRMHEDSVEQKETLTASLDNSLAHGRRLLQQNEMLFKSFEEVQRKNRHFDNQLIEFQQKMSLKQIQTEETAKEQIQMSYHQIEEKFNNQISILNSQLRSKEKLIVDLNDAIDQLQEEMILKDNEIDLAQLVIQDLQKQKENYISIKENYDNHPTYSPSINSSAQNFSPSPSQTIIRSNIKRNSLMQDLFDSHIRDESELPYLSHDYYGSEGVVQEELVEAQEQQNIVIRSEFVNKISPTSASSQEKSIREKLASATATFVQFNEISTQTAQQQLSSTPMTFIGWCKKRLITGRIKSH